MSNCCVCTCAKSSVWVREEGWETASRNMEMREGNGGALGGGGGRVG